MVYAVGRAKKVALVLGAGGPIGHAFHAGLLKALESKGYDPRQVSLVVGTSAGAQVGALLRAGMSASDMYARATGARMTCEGATIAAHFRRPEFGSPRRWGWPASPKYLLASLARPWRLRLGMVAAASLPTGKVDLAGLAAGFRERFEDVWPALGLWVCAANLDTGRRVLFGRAGAPKTDVGTAVAASSSVPSLCRPVEVEGARYVDGGMLSTNHADALIDADVDEVIISSPLSRFIGLRGTVRRSAVRLQAAGRRVRCFEPDREVAAAMGYNMMNVSRVPAVAGATFRRLQAALAE